LYANLSFSFLTHFLEAFFKNHPNNAKNSTKFCVFYTHIKISTLKASIPDPVNISYGSSSADQ
jgi:hypothetical protein